MAILGGILFGRRLRIEGQGVVLRPLGLADYAQWRTLRHTAQSYLQDSEPAEWLTPVNPISFLRTLVGQARDRWRDREYAFVVSRVADCALTGGITLYNVTRGRSATAFIGYWCSPTFARQGLTLASVRLASEFAFGTLGVERLSAACLAENEPSIRLLEQADFSRVGVAKDYLNINGVSRDHVLFGLACPRRAPAR